MGRCTPLAAGVIVFLGMMNAGVEFSAAEASEGSVGKKAGDIMIRLRGIGFLTDTDGTTDALRGDARTSNDWVPELDFSYFFTKNIAAELILGTTRHTVEVKDSAAGNLDLGTVRMLPPVLTLQYHFLPDHAFSPYVGVGLNYTIPYDVKKGRSVTSVDYSSEFGYAFQLGMDYLIDERWSLNVDVKKVFVDTDIKVNGGRINAKDTDLDPWVIGVGVGFRF